MLTKIRKFFDSWYERWQARIQQNRLYALALIGQVLVFLACISLVPAYLITMCIQKLDVFSDTSFNEIVLGIALIMMLAFAVLVVGNIMYIDEKARKKLSSREIADYEHKYPKHYLLVTKLLASSEYKEVFVPEIWIKRFDMYLSDTANTKLENYTDFEVVACLMYALTYNSVDWIEENAEFAFRCAQELLKHPYVYNCKHLDGDELILEPRVCLLDVQFDLSFDKLDANTLEVVTAIIKKYLSQRDNCSQILDLASFLHKIYLLCKDLSK